MELACGVFGVLELAAFGQVVPLEDDAHVVPILEVTVVLQFFAQFETAQPLEGLPVYVAHYQ